MDIFNVLSVAAPIVVTVILFYSARHAAHQAKALEILRTSTSGRLKDVEDHCERTTAKIETNRVELQSRIDTSEAKMNTLAERYGCRVSQKIDETEDHMRHLREELILLERRLSQVQIDNLKSLNAHVKEQHS